jgi:hypothetical protein
VEGKEETKSCRLRCWASWHGRRCNKCMWSKEGVQSGAERPL